MFKRILKMFLKILLILVFIGLLTVFVPRLVTGLTPARARIRLQRFLQSALPSSLVPACGGTVRRRLFCRIAWQWLQSYIFLARSRRS